MKIKKHMKTYITHTLNFMNYFKGHKVVKITTITKQIKSQLNQSILKYLHRFSACYPGQ